MAVRSVDIADDNARVCWSDVDGVVRQWNLQRHDWAAEPFRIPGLSLKRICYAPMQDTLALVAERSSTLALCSSVHGTCQKVFTFKSHSDVLQTVNFCREIQSDESCVYVITGETSLRLWAAEDNVCMQSFLGHEKQVLCTYLSADRRQLVSGSYDGTVRTWDVSTGKEEHVFQGHNDGATSVSVSPDEKTAVVGCGDGQLILWDLGSGRRIAKTRAHRGGPAYSVLFDVKGHWIASGGRDGVVHLSDSSRRLRKVADLVEHKSSVFDLAWSTDGRKLVSGSRDGNVNVWNLEDGRHDVTILDKSADTRQVKTVHLRSRASHTSQQAVPKSPLESMGSSSGSPNMNLRCPICFEKFDVDHRMPVVSGICGHTFACRPCYEDLGNRSETPQCTLCRSPLSDVAPNFELMSVITEQKKARDTMAPGLQLADVSTAFEESVNLDVSPADLVWIRDKSSIIGSGYLGSVYRGLLYGEPVAVKTLRKDLPALGKEAASMIRAMRYPNLMQVLGISRIETGETVIITELMSGGSLASSLAALDRLPINFRFSMAEQIARGLSHLHTLNLAHGSLTATNLLLSDPVSEWTVRSKVKLSDYGIRLALEAPPLYNPRYVAPECLADDKRTTDPLQADIYALGMILWEMFSAAPAWPNISGREVREKVLNDEKPRPLPPDFPGMVHDLITACWQRNPSERPTALDVINTITMVPTAPHLPPMDPDQF
mmetsp:Transcript_149/g.451  ORF Transcript_149/g.451 Transcript_149/m.451 type:complete len:717 (+) Transcript_149:100-2250(+)